MIGCHPLGGRQPGSARTGWFASVENLPPENSGLMSQPGIEMRAKRRSARRDAPSTSPVERTELRQRAEALLGQRPAEAEAVVERNYVILLHELSVYQIELELQNEELQLASEKAEQVCAKYYDLYDRAPVGYVTLDRSGRLVDINLTAAKLLGHTRAEIVGYPLMAFLRPGSFRTYATFLRTVFSREGISTCEVVLVRKRTPDIWVRIDGFRTNYGSAQPEHCRAVLLDITEQKRAEQALQTSEAATRKLNEELERKVSERTADLTRLVDSLQEEVRQRVMTEADLNASHEQLKIRAGQLRALASEITRAEQRERLRLATTLHDQIQQLLAAIKLQVAMLGRDERERVRQAAEEVLDMVGQCLTITRSLTSELHPPVLQLKGLAAAIEWVARAMSQKHGLRVHVKVEGEIPALAEDVKILLFEAARELLFNVVKHARAESATVSLRCASGSAVELAVSDDGLGFEPQESVRAGKDGGGFGLVCIRERLDLVGGVLNIVAAPGRGSRFTLTLPVTQDTTEVQLPMVQESDTASFAVRSDESIRVLLADDHAVLRAGLARLLALEPDLEVVGQAADGREAVELADRHRPEVILMDVSMPRLDGIGATRAIRASHPEIRVIGLSMYDESEYEQAMRAAGAVAFISKNAAATNLLSTIRAAGRRER